MFPNGKFGHLPDAGRLVDITKHKRSFYPLSVDIHDELFPIPLWRPLTTTFAPFWARMSVVPLPIPAVPPVIKATLLELPTDLFISIADSIVVLI